ncbi:MAG: bifunctional ornithine acetyltransferase/N-acetylglutamate synthase, partial [Planctomycetota bacterium]
MTHPRLHAPPARIELPPGFTAAGLSCGLKTDGALDLGLLLAADATPTAAIFSDTSLLGAHIPVCRDHLARSGGRARAILVNSRNANCSTGSRGVDDAYACCEAVAARIGCPTEQVLMASTGVIGSPLPADRIIDRVPALVDAADEDGGMDFARAIMTTDTQPKAESAAGEARVTGFAKGSGMIHPDMATMLGFLLTDGQPANPSLDATLREVADQSFHRVTVDGDTSPNDSLFLMARGGRAEAGSAQLQGVAVELSRQIAADGEGASRLVTVEVRGAPDPAAAAR